MKNLVYFQIHALVLFAFVWQTHAQVQPFDPAKTSELHGGLVLQLGAGDMDAPTQLSLTGRYLIHVLDPNPETVQSARVGLRKNGHYGMAWVEKYDGSGRLPYAENMANLIVVRDFSVADSELFRVLTPGGTLIVTHSERIKNSQLESSGFELVSKADSVLVARKPWPAEMDTWSHPRHASDGNAVSTDTLVGPPERVRWIAAATSEVEGMVSAGGRNFYGGILARDSFNGLRLWHSDLQRPNTGKPEEFFLPRLPRDGARPVASNRYVFAVAKGRAVALDSKTGQIATEFGDMVNPKSMVHDGSRIIASNDNSVRAFDIETGEEIWNVAATNPRKVVSDGKFVALIKGDPRRGESVEAVVLDGKTGDSKWQRSDYAWLESTTRMVLAKGQLVFEMSTLNDHDAGNGIHVVSAEKGEHRWSKKFAPGMNHQRQARAMFLEDDLWILHGAKINTSDTEKKKKVPVQVSALDPLTGEIRKSFPAGMAHCFPPVATPNFMFAGELDLTNLNSGEVVANRITKANCSRENGWVPANGLVYTTPKHCTCWPMLRGYVAMAPAIAGESVAKLPLEQISFLLENGPANADLDAPQPAADDWPLYRNDQWRSGSSGSSGPKLLKKQWRVKLSEPIDSKINLESAILHDWKDNPVVKGPLSAPTIANGLVYVTRPDAHELIAMDSSSGEIRWRFTANGRLDTPPSIHRGLCLFGSAAGWVYALRADTGELVWRRRAAPTEERIVAYGQVESPWPVPGAILVMNDIAYFAAGRQPLADGGILVFAIDPMTGKKHWVQKIDSVPQKGFYENSGLEFDPFDILHAEGDSLAMSRWIVSLDGKNVDVDKWNAFAKLNTGDGEVWVPRGSWTYGARHQDRFKGEAPRRPLVVFKDDNVYSSLNGTTTLFRRDFDLDQGEQFQSKWITGWEASKTARKEGKPYRTYRIAKGATWTEDPFSDPNLEKPETKYGTQLHNKIHAMALSNDGKLYVVHQDGRLKVVTAETGEILDEMQVPIPAWDGLAIANDRLFLTTQSGELWCMGD
ncbi:MAG: PQQ-binding-like beta-propeller repeat protein [Mariniblastus sp.]|nr:PQQ-binding-like beta-propeller repeat protein [Mariniblastus sp.]